MERGNSRLSTNEMDWMLEYIAAYTVASENMVVVWTTSPHLTPPPLQLREFSNAPMHWKNRTTTIPGVVS